MQKKAVVYENWLRLETANFLYAVILAVAFLHSLTSNFVYVNFIISSAVRQFTVHRKNDCIEVDRSP